MIRGQELGLAGGLIQGDIDDLAGLDTHHVAVLLLHDEAGGSGAEAGGQHAVVGTGGAAPLIVAGDGDPGLLAGELLQLIGNAVGDGGVGVSLLPAAALLLGEDLVILGDGPLGHRHNGEAAALLLPPLNELRHALDVVGDLRDQNGVGAAGHTGS